MWGIATSKGENEGEKKEGKKTMWEMVTIGILNLMEYRKPQVQETQNTKQK